MTTQFIVGRVYAERFLTDYDSIARFEILARTAKTVTTLVHGKIVRRKLSIEDGVEHFAPFGSYSMAMVVGADRLAETVQS